MFQGPVTLPYILKSIGLMKFKLGIVNLCDTKIDLIK